MRNFILNVMVGMILLLFSGCVNNSTSKPTKVNLGIKKEYMRIYVDNTLDKDKQKRVRDAFVYGINKMLENNEFKVEKTPGYIGEGNWDLIELQKDRIIKSYKINGKNVMKKNSLERNTNIYKFAPFYYVNLYNFIFNKKQQLSDPGLFNSSSFYKNKNIYKVTKINNNSFEIKGFNTKKEAIDIYLQIMRYSSLTYSDLLEDYMNEYMENHTDVGIDWTKMLYCHNIILYDPLELAENNKLILQPTILDSSKKIQIEALLEEKGFIVVNKPKKANIIISIQNLAYGKIWAINKDSKVIRDRLKLNKLQITNPNQSRSEYALATTNFTSMGGSTASTVAGISAALGLISIFDTSEYKVTSIDFVSIFINGENKYNFTISTNRFKIDQRKAVMYGGLQAGMDFLNYTIAEEILKKLFSNIDL